MLKGLFSKAAESYCNAVDRLLEPRGYVSSEMCRQVLGGLPKYSWTRGPDFVEWIFAPGKQYVILGQFRNAYNKILDASRKQQKEVLLTERDFEGEGFLYSFGELQRLQEEARESGAPALIGDVDLSFDWKSSVFARLAEEENKAAQL